MSRLFALAHRYALDPNPKAAAVALECVRKLVAAGASPIASQPTPMRFVADVCGGMQAKKSRDFFEALKPFFSGNRLLCDVAILVALIEGLDMRGLDRWSDIMELEDIVGDYELPPVL